MENNTTQVATQQQQQPQTLQSLMNSAPVLKKLNDVLGSEKKASAFVSSVISIATGSPQLRTATPMTVLGSAMVGTSSLSYLTRDRHSSR